MPILGYSEPLCVDVNESYPATIYLGVKKMSKLEALNLSHNRMIHFDLGLKPNEHALGELKYINCSHNHITAILTGKPRSYGYEIRATPWPVRMDHY